MSTGLKLEDVCRIWRGGCIIRAKLLEKLRQAYSAQPDLSHCFWMRIWPPRSAGRSQSLRAVARAAAEAGLPAPGFMSALAYLGRHAQREAARQLVQAQRDYFGGILSSVWTARGVFHHQWKK